MTGCVSTTPEVGEDVFVGSNTVLVAPVTIGDGAYTAAGSAISENVAAGDLGVARGRQHNSTGGSSATDRSRGRLTAAKRHRSESLNWLKSGSKGEL